jgi:glycerate-2-kinase
MNYRRIKNFDELTNHGNQKGRKAVVQILEAALQAADPYQNTCQLITIDKDEMRIGYKQFEPKGTPNPGILFIDLTKIGNIFVFGAGKGCQRVAKALEDSLDHWITGGHVIDKKGQKIILDKIDVTLGSHPLPDEDCVEGSERIIEMCKILDVNDLVFTVTTNGISSLLTKPVPGISVAEVRSLTYLLQIVHGAPTIDLNSVRNHLDMLKGGRISRLLKPATVIHIIADDPMDHNWLMEKNFWLATLPDYSTFQDAINVLKKWNIWNSVSPSTIKHLMKADPLYETVKANEFKEMNYRIFGVMPHNTGMIQAAKQKAKQLGYKPLFLCNKLQAEASQAGKVISSIALTIEKTGEPIKSPCAILTSGELFVTVGSKQNVGGRNQEFVLSAAEKIEGNRNIVIGAVDSDGSDGPGSQFIESPDQVIVLAGGLVDGGTLSKAKRAGFNIQKTLTDHNSTLLLRELRSGIIATPNISLDDISVTLIDENQNVE